MAKKKVNAVEAVLEGGKEIVSEVFEVKDQAVLYVKTALGLQS